MECDVHYAKSNLSKLIRQAESGEEVIITRRGEHVAQLVAVTKPKPEFGKLTGKEPPDDSLLFAMPDSEADDFIEGNWA